MKPHILKTRFGWVVQPSRNSIGIVVGYGSTMQKAWAFYEDYLTNLYAWGLR